MILEFSNPMPVVTPVGGGYAIYVKESGTFENDVWTVAMEDGGQVLHFRTDQIRMYANATFDLQKDESPHIIASGDVKPKHYD